MEIQRARNGLLASEPVLLLAIVIAVLYFGRPILIPVALALTLNFLLAPAVIYLHRFRIRRVPAVIIVVVIAGSIVGSVGWVVARQLVRIADQMPDYRENLHQKMEALHAPSVSPFSRAINGVKEVGQEFYGTAQSPTPPAALPATGAAPASRPRKTKTAESDAVPAPVPVQAAPTPVVVVQPSRGIPDLIATLIPVVRPLGETVFVLVLTIYMLINREDLHNRLLLLAGMGHLNLVTKALDDAGKRISTYLTINFLVNAGYGLCFGLGLFAIGIPNATLWGVIASILRFVPYIGTSMGVLLPFVFALGVYGPWGPALVVLALFGLLEFSVSNFLEPWLYGSHTGISTLALLIMAVFWTLLWGWPGLVLSTPLTVCLIVMGLHLPEMSFLKTLLGDDAELAPEAKFYERLLAMDQAEARAIAERFLASHPMAELYDTILLPALFLAERDRHQGSLDQVRANFVFQCANELIAELSDTAILSADGTPQGSSRLRVKSFPVICVSTQDQADEIVATMLAQILEQAGNRTLQLPSHALSDEILSRLAEETDTVIYISAIPPFAFADTRALCQRIRHRLPQNRIVVGLWDSTIDAERVRERLSTCHPDRVVTNLSQALAIAREWQEPGLYPELAVRASREN
ncbi:transport protein [Acidisarcina polymorpha]|uniref:Transport protein n=1 Tax=Acidisarcina polymorpha TaxID=2211140 RepID=A0A2Z5FY73_9BACT|nr:AI-2E family transporter [Acidisarcina polymorpha]AXC11811.1 transport protein [Acidisarcina polymorpha]